MPGTFKHTFDTPAFKGDVEIPLGLFINGEFVDGSEGKTIECVPLLSI
jgi:aldehyde dehydrogenase (NAD+)